VVIIVTQCAPGIITETVMPVADLETVMIVALHGSEHEVKYESDGQYISMGPLFANSKELSVPALQAALVLGPVSPCVRVLCESCVSRTASGIRLSYLAGGSEKVLTTLECCNWGSHVCITCASGQINRCIKANTYATCAFQQRCPPRIAQA
jgi:hypothetical protein